MLRAVTEQILGKEDLSFEQAEEALNSILLGQCDEVAIAGFLTVLAAKGERAQEVAGMARALRNHAVTVKPQTKRLIDIVGTGGDGSSTFNISTTAALVVSGAGVKVAKHGNRAITSKCGSADILAELGVKIDAAPETIARCIDEANIGFMFAPSHHPTMKYVQPIRKALGFRTVFNILGPLANPAGVSAQFTGVARPELVAVMVEALKLLGVRRAMVVHGDGMDEISISGTTQIAHLHEGVIIHDAIEPERFGITSAFVETLAGGSVGENAAITRGILAGSETGPRRDVVLINAAGALMVAEKAGSFEEGIKLAAESIADGQAVEALEKLVEISNS